MRYVLEGGMRNAGSRIRVTARLVEAETGKHVWAERYDRDLADIFAVQDEITEAVTIAIAPAIAEAERRRAMRKPPGSLDAWAAYQHGLWHLAQFSPAEVALAEGFFQRAIDLDPNFSGGYWGLAFAQHTGARLFQRRTLTEVQEAAEMLCRRAVALDGADAEARACLSIILAARGDYKGARAEAERALKLGPNLARAHHALAHTLIFGGQPKDGLAAVESCIRFGPQDPAMPQLLNMMEVSLYFSGEYDAVVEVGTQTTRSFPDYPTPYRWLAAALGQTGRIEEARDTLERAIGLFPDRLSCTPASGRRGCGRRTMPICSRICARPDRRADATGSQCIGVARIGE